MAKKKSKTDKIADTDLLQQLRDEYKSAEALMNNYVDTWDKVYKSYMNKRDDIIVSVNGKSKITIPALFYIIETIVPRLAVKLLGAKPVFKVLGRTFEDMDNANLIEVLLDYQLEDINFNTKIISVIRDVLLYSVGFIKYFWDYDVYNGDDKPNFMVCSPKSIFIDPDATSIDDARYAIHKVYLSKAQIKKYIEKGVFNLINSIDDIDNLQDNKEKQETVIGLSTKIKGKYLFYEHWTPNKVYTYTEGKLVRNDDNPYGRIPIIDFKNYPLTDQFYNISDGAMILDLEEELITKRRQRLDNINFVLNTMWILERGNDIDEEELVSRSGGIIHTNNKDALDPVKIPDVTMSSFNETNDLEREMQNISGATDYLRGISEHSRETATSVQTLSAAGNMRFFVKLLSIYQSFSKIAKAFIDMDRKFMTKKRVLRIAGDFPIPSDKQGNPISPDDFKQATDAAGNIYTFFNLSKDSVTGMYDFIPLLSQNISSNLMGRGNMLLQLFGMLKDSNYINQYNFVKKIFDVLQIEDTGNLLKTQKELAEEEKARQAALQQYLAAQAAAGQQPGAPQGQPQQAQPQQAQPQQAAPQGTPLPGATPQGEA